MKAFCDGSGSFDSSPFVVLAGVAASEGVWVGFEREWSRILNNRDPAAPYLHMRELCHAQEAFSDENGWDETKRQSLLTDCVLYLQTLDKLSFRSFICSIDMGKYRQLKDDGELLPSAVAICNRFVPMQIFRWYLENFERWLLPEIHYYFDQNERFKGPFENQIRQRQKQSRLSNHWHMIRQVTPVDMRFYPPLQLADLLAWAHYRKLSYNDPNMKWRSTHIFTDAILPYTRKDIDAETLENMARLGRFSDVPTEYFK